MVFHYCSVEAEGNNMRIFLTDTDPAGSWYLLDLNLFSQDIFSAQHGAIVDKHYSGSVELDS